MRRSASGANPILSSRACRGISCFTFSSRRSRKLEVPRQARDDNKRLADETAWQIHRGCEEMEIIGARDFDGAELLEMRREPLRIKENEAALPQMLDQTEQRDLRGVADMMEHRFAEECAADRDTVKAARQFAILPRFD